MVARASEVFVGRARELDELERALDAARAGKRRDRPRRRGGGHRQVPARSRARETCRGAGFQVLVGRSIDLVGTELPYQPFVDALRPLGSPGRSPADAGSQLRVFEIRSRCSPIGAAPHPCCSCSRTCTGPMPRRSTSSSSSPTTSPTARFFCSRPTAPTSPRRPSACAGWPTRSPLRLGARSRARSARARRADGAARGSRRCLPPAALADTIVARSEGNPFFAEELLAVAGDRRRAPAGPARPAAAARRRARRADAEPAAPRRGRRTRRRLPAAPGGRGTSGAGPARLAPPSGGARCPGGRAGARQLPLPPRAAGGGGVLDDPARGARGAARAPRRGAPRSGAAGPAELAPHWAAAGRTPEALVASVEAARQAEAVFGLAEAHAHLERALTLWDAVPDRPSSCGSTSPSSAPGRPSSPAKPGRRRARSSSCAERSIWSGTATRCARRGSTTASAATCTRAAGPTPPSPHSSAWSSSCRRSHHPPSARRRWRRSRGLMLAWRFDESLALCEQALALARAVGAQAVELWALWDLGRDLAYLGRGDDGIEYLGRALALAEESGDPLSASAAYVSLTDVLMMLGRPAESARVGETGLEVMRRYGVDSTVLVANSIEALLAIGEWDQADRASAAALRAITANFPYMLLMLRADLELGRGDFEAARAHLEAALATLREDRGQGIYDVFLAELALWERRWTEADQAVRDGLARARSRQAAQLRVWFCAKGLRAQAELAALARARRDADAVRTWLTRAGSSWRSLDARRPRRRRSRRTPAAGWRWPRPSTQRAPRRRAARVVGGRRRQPGSGSSARPSRRTAAGVRPRRSSPPAPHAPRRACRSARRTPSRSGSAPSPCFASSSCSPSARGSTSRRPQAAVPAAKRRARGDPRPDPARGGGPGARRSRLYEPRDRRDARHQRQDGRASTSRTSCASSARRTGSRPAAIAHRLAPPFTGQSASKGQDEIPSRRGRSRAVPLAPFHGVRTTAGQLRPFPNWDDLRAPGLGISPARVGK